MIQVQTFVQAAVANFPGVVEITDAEGTSQLLGVKSDAVGKAEVGVPVALSRCGVQVLMSSTIGAAEAESDVQSILIS